MGSVHSFLVLATSPMVFSEPGQKLQLDVGTAAFKASKAKDVERSKP
jgi:hypothetical protein